LISFCCSFIFDSRALSAVSIKFIILFSSEVDATNVVETKLDVDDELDVEAKLDVDDELDVDADFTTRKKKNTKFFKNYILLKIKNYESLQKVMI